MMQGEVTFAREDIESDTAKRLRPAVVEAAIEAEDFFVRSRC